MKYWPISARGRHRAFPFEGTEACRRRVKSADKQCAICSDRILHYYSRVTQRLKIAAASCLLILGAFVFTSSAQEPTDLAQPFSPAPYQLGERLTYTVSFSNFISAAHVEVLVSSRGTFFGRDGVQLKGHVETNGVINAALFAINNDYVTYVDPQNGLPFRAQQTIRESARTAETEADFNQPAGTVAIPPKTSDPFPGTYDLLSLLYRVRALPLTEGSSYALSIRNDKQTYRLDVHVNGHEVIKTNVGSFNTVVAQLRLKPPDGDSYSIKAYFSDDQRHVPVLMITRIRAGEIRVELAGSAFIATPPQPPVPRSTPSPSATSAQTPVVIPPTAPAPDAGLGDLPFTVGEQLNYQIFLPNVKAVVGTATFQVKARSKYFDHDGLMFTLEARTTNALQKVFAANDSITSYVDPKTLLPFHTEFVFNEGRRRVASKLTLNQDYGTATTDKGERIDIPIGTHDYLSYFYVVRTFNLTPSRRNALSILVNNQPKTLFVTAIKRETIQLGSQSVPAIMVSLTTDDPQADKYQLRGWISDDKRRLPLRLSANTALGEVRADLAILPVTRQ